MGRTFILPVFEKLTPISFRNCSAELFERLTLRIACATSAAVIVPLLFVLNLTMFVHLADIIEPPSFIPIKNSGNIASFANVSNILGKK